MSFTSGLLSIEVVTFVKPNMDALRSQVTRLAEDTDPTARKNLLTTLRNLSYSIEDADDTLNRIGYLVRISQPALIFYLSMSLDGA